MKNLFVSKSGDIFLKLIDLFSLFEKTQFSKNCQAVVEVTPASRKGGIGTGLGATNTARQHNAIKIPTNALLDDNGAPITDPLTGQFITQPRKKNKMSARARGSGFMVRGTGAGSGATDDMLPTLTASAPDMVRRGTSSGVGWMGPRNRRPLSV